MQARDIMTKDVIFAAADTTVDQITTLMMENHISAVPILDDGGALIGIVSEGANAAGAAFAGALPYQGPAGQAPAVTGLDLGQMLASPVKGLVLLGVEPEFDCADDVAAMNAVSDASFIVALTPWLTASAEERARRRHKQLKDKGLDVSLAALSRDIENRDRRDSERTIAPLKPALDARYLDSSGQSIEAVTQQVLDWVAEL